MFTPDLIQELRKHTNAIEDKEDKRAGISSFYRRCCINGQPVFAVGGEREKDVRIDAVVQGIHWCRTYYPQATSMKLLWGSGTGGSEAEVFGAIGTLLAAYKGKTKIEAQIDFQPWKYPPPNLCDASKKWEKLLNNRLNQTIPPHFKGLSAAIGKGMESFRWYRNVRDNQWSGRVEGLEVCKISSDGQRGELNVGKLSQAGCQSKARITFLDLVGGASGSFLLPEDTKRIAVAIQTLVKARMAGGILADVETEHHLESRILRGDVTIEIPGIGKLEPAIREVPFQFPTVWGDGGKARYIDALMRKDSIPWVLELKVDRGQGSYYRHAITQAVLYREFIRAATPLHNWFEKLNLEALQCRAAVVIPELRGPRKDKLLADLLACATAFDVSVVALPTL